MKLVGVAGRKGVGKDTVGDRLATAHGWVRVALADPIKQLAAELFEFSELLLFGPSVYREQPVTLTNEQWLSVYWRAGDLRTKVRALFDDKLGAKVDARWRWLIDHCRNSTMGTALTPRKVLQWMGTEFGRELDPNVWVNAAIGNVQRLGGGRYAYDRMVGCVATRDPAPPGVVITDVRFPNELKAVHDAGGKVYWIDASRRVPASGDPHASEPTQETFERMLDGVIVNDGTVQDLLARVDALVTGP